MACLPKDGYCLSLAPSSPLPVPLLSSQGQRLVQKVPGQSGGKHGQSAGWGLGTAGLPPASLCAGVGEAAPWGLPDPFPAQQGATGLSHTLPAACPVT